MKRKWWDKPKYAEFSDMAVAAMNAINSNQDDLAEIQKVMKDHGWTSLRVMRACYMVVIGNYLLKREAGITIPEGLLFELGCDVAAMDEAERIKAGLA